MLAFAILLATRTAFADDTTPTWNKQIRLTDGRTFVTDGSMTIDAAVAKPAALPETVIPGAKIIEGYLAAKPPDEVALAALARGKRSGTYQSPTGVVLSAKYVDFLRGVVPNATLRMKGTREPVVVLSNGRPVGVVMPMVP